MSVVGAGRMYAAEAGKTSAVETRRLEVSDAGPGPKTLKMARNGWRIGPDASHGRSQASGTGPAAQNLATNPKSFRGTPPLQFQQDGYKIDTAM